MYLEEDDLINSNDAEVEEAEDREQLLSKRLCQREDLDFHTYKSKQIKHCQTTVTSGQLPIV